MTSRAMRPLMRAMTRDDLRSLWENPSSITPATMASIMALSGPYGALYDLSATDVLWQDTRGTSVSDVEQPVAVVMDNRLGQARGAEQFLGMDATTWTFGGAASKTNSKVSIADVAAVDGYAAFPLALPIGSAVEVTVSYENRTNAAIGGLRLRSSSAAGGNANMDAAIPGPVGTGSGTVKFLTGYNPQWFTFMVSGTDHSVTITNVSIKVILGNHLSQATSTARPLIRLDNGKGYLWYDGVDDQLVGVDLGTVKANMLIGTAGSIETANTLTNRAFNYGDSVSRLSVQYFGSTNSLRSSSGYSGLPGPIEHIHATLPITEKYHVLHWQTASDVYARYNDFAETAGLAHPVGAMTSGLEDISVPQNAASGTIQRWYGGLVFDGATTAAQRNTMQEWLMSKRGLNSAGAGI